MLFLKFKELCIDFSLPYVIPTNPALDAGVWRNLKKDPSTSLGMTMAYKQKRPE
ncbi:MAG: hypothetical protein OEY94_07470 [Alphaproteobacteria bacterium]|nr:hypothetical protein [Alphaproteobacteria bacterium]